MGAGQHAFVVFDCAAACHRQRFRGGLILRRRQGQVSGKLDTTTNVILVTRWEHFLQAKRLPSAGSDRERAADVMKLFVDRKVDVILCVRGGYGAARFANPAHR